MKIWSHKVKPEILRTKLHRKVIVTEYIDVIELQIHTIHKIPVKVGTNYVTQTT